VDEEAIGRRSGLPLQPRIQATAADQVVVYAFLDDRAAVEHDDPVGVAQWRDGGR
jgi:hypothetical protein